MGEKTTIYIDPEVKEQAQIKCIKDKTSLSQVITQLLKEWINKST